MWICATYCPINGVYHGGSYLYDDLGNEYYVSGVTLGKESGRDISRNLAPQTPTRFTLRFENVSQEAKIAVTLILNTSAGDLTFRNIPLSE